MDGIPGVLISLDINEMLLDQILDAVVPYLHCEFPPNMQLHARHFMEKLWLFDGAAVYVKLHSARAHDDDGYGENIKLIWNFLRLKH